MFTYDRFKGLDSGDRALIISTTKNNTVKVNFSPPKPGAWTIAGAIFRDVLIGTKAGVDIQAINKSRAEIDEIYAEILQLCIEISEAVDKRHLIT